MKKNLVAMMVTVVMVAGALVGCGSKEVAQETTPVVEATVEATVEENAVDAAASTEESVVEETVVEEVEPQTKEMKVLIGRILLRDGVFNGVYTYIYDEFGNPVKVIYNDYTNEECDSILTSENFSPEDLMNFGEKYVYEYADVTKSENGRILECDWYSADGTSMNNHAVYTYNELGSILTKDEAGGHEEFTYDENNFVTSVHYVNADGTVVDTVADQITSATDEDGTLVHVSYATEHPSEVFYFYTTIEVTVQ